MALRALFLAGFCIAVSCIPLQQRRFDDHVASRQAMIDEINANPNASWVAAMPARFRGSPVGSSKSLMGVIGDWRADVAAAIERGEVQRFQPDEAMDVPESFDSAENWPKCAKMINDIRDQSNCGCCWAFAGAEAASDRMCITTEAAMMVPLSAEDVCFCGLMSVSGGCNGGQISTPWNHIKMWGAVTGGQYHGSGPFGSGFCADFSLPHCHHHGPQRNDPYPAEGAPGCPSQRSPSCPRKCGANASSAHSDWSKDKISYSGRTESASGEERVQQMIMKGGPVETAFTVYSDFENYASGVYKHVSGAPVGGHAVKITGWGVDGGVKYWKVANSWNPYWGEKGFFRVVRGDSDGSGGIEDSVIGAAADAKWAKKA